MTTGSNQSDEVSFTNWYGETRRQTARVTYCQLHEVVRSVAGPRHEPLRLIRHQDSVERTGGSEHQLANCCLSCRHRPVQGIGGVPFHLMLNPIECASKPQPCSYY